MLFGPSWKDDDVFVLNHLLPKHSALDIGSAQFQWRDIYISGTIKGTGGFTIDLPNNIYLQSKNAAGSGTVDLLKADATDNSVINAGTGKQIKFAVNNVTIGTADNNSIDFPAFNLLDGSPVNYTLAGYGTGTAYTYTATSAAVVFGTTSPTITINKAGTYLLTAGLINEYAGATFASDRTITLKIRRTNNTAADIATIVIHSGVTTTATQSTGSWALGPVLYTTTNTNDVLTIFADVSVLPSPGALNVSSAAIIASRLY